PEGTEAIPVLIEALKPRYGVNRIVAVQGLSKFGPKAKAAVPALQEVLADEDISIRRHIQDVQAAINSIDTETSLQDLIAQLENPKGSVPARVAALNRIAQLGRQAKPAMPALLKGVKDSNRDIRLHAALALAGIGAEPSLTIPIVLEVVAEPE